MEYKPRHGVDYIISLYGIAGVPPDADPAAIEGAINTLLPQYHIDRFQGLAPEFQSDAERKMRLLILAKEVLLNEKLRREHDQLLADWEGPVSEDGVPTIGIDSAFRAVAARYSPEELEAAFTKRREQSVTLTGHNPKQLALLGRLYETADEETAPDLRDAYDEALLAQDRVLALEEAARAQLLGLPHNAGYETSPGYYNEVRAAIESARTAQIEAYQRRALGAVSTRLALAAGETPPVRQGDIVPAAAGGLPPYFDAQAKAIMDLADEREDLLEIRLGIFQPTYPIAELQTEAKPNLAIGIKRNQEDQVVAWIGFSFAVDTITLTTSDLPDDLAALLTSGEYEQAYSAGYNILTFAAKEHIEISALLRRACSTYVRKYYPDLLGD